MSSEDTVLLESRKAGFQAFYNELMPSLVDFISKIGINPAHEVLNQAEKYVPFVEQALQEMAIADQADRIWLLTRVGYFFGEYFVQKYAGCWYVNELQGSRYFGRYVVGKFMKTNNLATMIDPFELAQVYVDSSTPRKFTALLSEVEAELVG